MKSFLRIGKDTFSLTAFKFASEPRKTPGSVKTEIATAPACSISRASLEAVAGKISLKILPGDAGLISAITDTNLSAFAPSNAEKKSLFSNCIPIYSERLCDPKA
jgi:hypothetical protein